MGPRAGAYPVSTGGGATASTSCGLGSERAAPPRRRRNGRRRATAERAPDPPGPVGRRPRVSRRAAAPASRPAARAPGPGAAVGAGAVAGGAEVIAGVAGGGEARGSGVNGGAGGAGVGGVTTGTTGAASCFGLRRKEISFFQTEVAAGFASWTGALRLPPEGDLLLPDGGGRRLRLLDGRLRLRLPPEGDLLLPDRGLVLLCHLSLPPAVGRRRRTHRPSSAEPSPSARATRAAGPGSSTPRARPPA